MNRIPVISVGMPVYNGEQYLESAIRAVLDQTCEDLELIISDNASTDRTAQICNDFAARDSRVRFSRNPDNIGAARNYNRVFELAPDVSMHLIVIDTSPMIPCPPLPPWQPVLTFTLAITNQHPLKKTL